MTAKQYLEEVFEIRDRIIELEQREEELRTIAEGLRAIVYDKDHVQVSPSNKLEETVTEMVEVGNQYGRKILELNREIEQRYNLIRDMKPGHFEILNWRYLRHNGHGKQLTLREIADAADYSFDHVRRLHREGLAEFAKRNEKMLKEKDDTQCHTHPC